ncbi:hypothetical protein ACQP0C_23480 [Nocardia sp. CA-129566]|uniref:hypothetical protein n=1 Tax=Nocardia sp. CA-129566 TaxID=3239976 RepID=UPI003D977984
MHTFSPDAQTPDDTPTEQAARRAFVSLALAVHLGLGEVRDNPDSTRIATVSDGQVSVVVGGADLVVGVLPGESMALRG